jgi:hypothetical protein
MTTHTCIACDGISDKLLHKGGVNTATGSEFLLRVVAASSAAGSVSLEEVACGCTCTRPLPSSMNVDHKQ